MEKRFLSVFNTFTRKYERIEVTDEVYRGYMQSEWNMKDNDHSFYQHQIQFSALIGNKDQAFENFKEFMGLTQDTEDEVEKNELYDALHKALKIMQSNLGCIYLSTESGGLDALDTNRNLIETGTVLMLNADGGTEYSGTIEKLTSHGTLSQS